MLGLARESFEGDDCFLKWRKGMYPSYEIDYDSTVSEVYQRVTKHLINRDLDFDILCLVICLRDAGSENLPTWVPDWRAPWDSNRAPGIGDMWFDIHLHLNVLATSFTRAEKRD